MTNWIDPDYSLRKYKLQQIKANLTYNKEDLVSLLKRHSGQDPTCDCNCPFTGHSISMLIMFVCSENDLDKKVQKKALDLYQAINRSVCFVQKSRLVIAAALVYIASLHILGYGQYSQDYLATLFYVTSPSIRLRYKEIVHLLPDKPGYRYVENI